MRPLRSSFALLVGAVILSLLLPCLAYGQVGTYDWSGATDLYPGIKHAAVTETSPRDLVMDALRIDITTPNLRFDTTGRASPFALGSTETLRETTREFINGSQATAKKVVVAINGDPYAVSGAYANLQGMAVSGGLLVSNAADSTSFIVGDNGAISLVTTSSGHDISSIQTAVSSYGFVLTAGVVSGPLDFLAARSGTGISQNSQYVYFMTIDGNQPASDGVMFGEVGSWLKYFGAYDGINMDGGGSSTLAWWDPAAVGADKSTLLNSPRAAGYSTSVAERNVGNSLGVYYVPEPSSLLLFLTFGVVSLRRRQKRLRQIDK